MIISGTDQLWRQPESGWCRPEVVAVALGVDLRRLDALVEGGCFERRSSDGAIWVCGHDEDPLAPNRERSASEAIGAVGEALSALSGDLSRARLCEIPCPAAQGALDLAEDTPPPLPLADASATSGGRTRFAFPFGIAL